MATDNTFLDMIRVSSELVRESVELRKRARECMSSSYVIMSHSRELLSQWTVSGAPALTHPLVPTLDLPASPLQAALPEAGRVAPAPPAAPPEPGLERVEERTFIGEIVLLDGKHFADCVLENCTLEYWGGPVILEGTHFSGCRFSFGGEAAMTVSILECFGLIGEGSLKEAGTFAAGTPPRQVN